LLSPSGAATRTARACATLKNGCGRRSSHTYPDPSRAGGGWRVDIDAKPIVADKVPNTLVVAVVAFTILVCRHVRAALKEGGGDG